MLLTALAASTFSPKVYSPASRVSKILLKDQSDCVSHIHPLKRKKHHLYQSLSWLPLEKKATESLLQSVLWFPLFPWPLTPSLFHFLSVFQPQDVGHSRDTPDSFQGLDQHVMSWHSIELSVNYS